jgi:hypothetical protein
MAYTGTHTKRLATQHGCLPSLLGDGDNGIEIVYSEEKNIFCIYQTRAPRQNKKLWYRQERPNDPTKKGYLSFVLFESPFAPQFQPTSMVSTVSRGHPSLVVQFTDGSN